MPQSKNIIEVDNVSKRYKLGEVGTGTLTHDLNRMWHKMLGKPDPYKLVTQKNDRSQAGGDYVWALNNVSFNLEKGDILAVIGNNGAGKSTLLKLISRITRPSEGEIRFDGRLASLLEVGTGFHLELTGRENIYLNGAILGMTKSEIKSKLDEIVEFSGCAKYLDTPVKRYSSGMIVRLGFAVAAHLESDILVVDEVLAVGDQEFQNKCLGKMKDISRGGRTVLFVSHNLSSVKKLCNKGLLLENGQSTYFGDIDRAVNQYLRNENSGTGSFIDLSDFKGRQGTGDIQIQSLEILVDGLPSNKLLLGQNLGLKIRIKAKSKVRYKMAIHLYRSDQTRLANIENMDSNLVLEPFEGEGEMFIEFKNFMFYPNRYILSLWIGDISSHEHIDYLKNCAVFEVLEGSKIIPRALPSPTGIIFLSPDWHFSRLNPTNRV